MSQLWVKSKCSVDVIRWIRWLIFLSDWEERTGRKGCGGGWELCPSMLTIYHGNCFHFVPWLTLFILHYDEYYSYFQENPMRILQITCRTAAQSVWSPPLSTPHPFLLTLCTRDILTEIPFFNIHPQHSSLSHIDCGWIKSTWCRASLIRRVF